MQPERGDVVRSSDPFKLGESNQRPWLIVNNESHPFSNQQFVAVAISTREYNDSIALHSSVWKTGGATRPSFVSPWAIHSPRIEDVVAWQGGIRESYVDHVIDTLETYLR